MTASSSTSPGSTASSSVCGERGPGNGVWASEHGRPGSTARGHRELVPGTLTLTHLISDVMPDLLGAAWGRGPFSFPAHRPYQTVGGFVELLTSVPWHPSEINMSAITSHRSPQRRMQPGRCTLQCLMETRWIHASGVHGLSNYPERGPRVRQHQQVVRRESLKCHADPRCLGLNDPVGLAPEFAGVIESGVGDEPCCRDSVMGLMLPSVATVRMGEGSTTVSDCDSTPTGFVAFTLVVL